MLFWASAATAMKGDEEASLTHLLAGNRSLRWINRLSDTASGFIMRENRGRMRPVSAEISIKVLARPKERRQI
jgi:hypothetical protein